MCATATPGAKAPTEYETPRRNRLDLNTPAELAIHNAMQEVEKLAADTRLTDAINLLQQAKELVSDFVDTDTAG